MIDRHLGVIVQLCQELLRSGVLANLHKYRTSPALLAREPPSLTQLWYPWALQEGPDIGLTWANSNAMAPGPNCEFWHRCLACWITCMTRFLGSPVGSPADRR